MSKKKHVVMIDKEKRTVERQSDDFFIYNKSDVIRVYGEVKDSINLQSLVENNPQYKAILVTTWDGKEWLTRRYGISDVEVIEKHSGITININI